MRASRAFSEEQGLEFDRQQIYNQVSACYEAEHAPEPFVPGQTRIQYAGRVYDERELIALVDASLDFWLTLGKNGALFEAALAEYLGVSHAIMVNSGSSANLVAIAALCSPQADRPLQPGDEVITPAATFPTTVAPLVQNNLVPVFVDCELGTYNADPGEVERALSERTRALFVPHMLGNACQMDQLMAIARQHDLYVVEDVCEAMGTRFGGQMLGTFGQMSTFSFYPAHHITTGEGGAVATGDDRLARIARSIRDWGRDCWCDHQTMHQTNGACGCRFSYQIPGVPGTYDHKYIYSHVGYNLRPTDMQAALGLVQLEKLPAFIEARKRNFAALYAALSRFDEHLLLPTWDPQADVSWFALPITVRDNPRFTRNDLVRWLEAGRIETRLLMAGNIVRQPGFAHIQHRTVGELANTDLVMRGAFFVGVYPGLDRPRLAYMIERFEAFFNQL
jgi:CDP-6-deoxy-D-xylo-4-hexulose-3-dehydrase